MNLADSIEPVKLEMQIAPLIDVVFLLLIYFMVTAALVKKEGDISFALPGASSPVTPASVPTEAIIEIEADGTVIMEGMRFPNSDEKLRELGSHIKGLKKMAESQGSTFFVNIMPHRNAVHKRVIEVMDSCAAADVKSLTFSKSM